LFPALQTKLSLNTSHVSFYNYMARITQNCL
jgi:hypothetical protein